LALPAETEERVKRRALNVCQDHLRKVLDLTRKMPQLVDCFMRNDKEHARTLFNEIRSGEDEVDKARRLVSQELAEIGAILLSREDFLRFTNLTSEIADFSEGIAFRLVEIMDHNWNVPGDIKKDLLKLSEAVLETVLRLRETMMVLSYGSGKAMEKAQDVEIAERAVDEIYRELEIKLLSSKIDFPALILLRDVLQLLEDSADKCEDAADSARILSLIM
jgi:predicted phosphate transport protein (TIGR00153 family)